MSVYDHLLDERRIDLFKRLGRRVQRYATDTPTSCYLYLRSDESEVRVKGEGMTDALRLRATNRIFPLLAELASASPLEKGADLREILEIEIHGHSGYAYLVIRNGIGVEEHVTTMFTRPAAAMIYDLWCASREMSVVEDTAWDRARQERRIVQDAGGPSIIDPGVLHVIDLIVESGGRTTSSCEGHPWGGYISMNRNPVIAQVFRDLGWELEDGGAIVRMPMPKDVLDRDRMWREASTALEAALRPASAPRR